MDKPVEDFQPSVLDLTWKACRSCMSEYPSQSPEAIRDRNARTKQRNKDWLHSYLLCHPCVDCGEPDLVVLDFDHMRDKKYQISKLVNSTCSLARLQAEVAKCDVVCANCHRRRTAKTQRWSKLSVVA